MMEREKLIKDNFESVTDVSVFFQNLTNSLETENRFFPDKRLRTSIDELLRCKTAKRLIKKGKILYRARIYDISKDTNLNKPHQFNGYDAENSTINTNDSWPRAGRMNPEGIHILYVATGVKTCAKEIGVAANEQVSIAAMEVQRDLRVVDFPMLAGRLRNQKKKALACCINDVLSKGYGGRTYVFPQYISMYCKYLGYDGVVYRSKYANKSDSQTGMNIAIFDYNDCIPVASEIKIVKKISLEFEK